MIGKLTTNDDTDRGQVGIGTLIVFIAMVLVAAIAAGVLVNTAGVLQGQAEATGEESQSQVSDRIQVVNSVYDDDSDLTEITISKSAGADTISLSDDDLSIEVIIDNEDATGDVINHDSDGLEDGSVEELSDRGDTATVEIDRNLDGGERIDVLFIEESGATTRYITQAPQTIVDGNVVTL